MKSRWDINPVGRSVALTAVRRTSGGRIYDGYGRLNLLPTGVTERWSLALHWARFMGV